MPMMRILALAASLVLPIVTLAQQQINAAQKPADPKAP
jgi:hypothetical protein